MPAPAELFTSPKLDSTFLLDLIALVRKGQMGGWDLRVRGVQKKGVVVLGLWSVTRPQRCRGV